MSRLMDIYIDRVVRYLVAEGKRIIDDAIRSKETKNRSYTQYDSYGLIVYYNGRVMTSAMAYDPEPGKDYASYAEPNWTSGVDDASTQRHKGWPKGGVPDGTGAEWAKLFKRQFKRPNDGFALVVFNAAFYSKVQEEGGGNLKRKYRILSQVTGSFKELQKKFKGSTLSGYNITLQ